jgi:hypothetical protein
MDNSELEKQKVFVKVFIELEKQLKTLNSKVNELGWKQRNALISHVYSDYNKHDELNEKREKWKKYLLKQNVVQWIYDLFIKERDLYGYFNDLEYIKSELNELINEAISTERFEIATELKKWNDKIV